MISPLSFVDISLYIDSEWDQSPLSHNKKYCLLTVTLKHMDAQGHTNIAQKPKGIYTECSSLLKSAIRTKTTITLCEN